MSKKEIAPVDGYSDEAYRRVLDVRQEIIADVEARAGELLDLMSIYEEEMAALPPGAAYPKEKMGEYEEIKTEANHIVGEVDPSGHYLAILNDLHRLEKNKEHIGRAEERAGVWDTYRRECVAALRRLHEWISGELGRRIDTLIDELQGAGPERMEEVTQTLAELEDDIRAYERKQFARMAQQTRYGTAPDSDDLTVSPA